MDPAVGEFRLVHGAPHAALRAHVRGYEGGEERRPAPVTRLEPPNGRVVLIAAWRGGFAVGERRVTSFAAGLSPSTARVRSDAQTAGLQVDLTPLGARRLLGLPLRELTDVAAPLGEVLGRAGAELPERLEAAPSWAARFALVDEALLARLRDAEPLAPAIVLAWRRVVESGGRVRVAELARESGWSERQLARRFQDAVGLTPKTYARIVRFDRALGMLRAGTPPAEVAYSCGFADQPHLNREFRDLVGLPPTALLAHATDVGFVQEPRREPA